MPKMRASEPDGGQTRMLIPPPLGGGFNVTVIDDAVEVTDAIQS